MDLGGGEGRGEWGGEGDALIQAILVSSKDHVVKVRQGRGGVCHPQGEVEGGCFLPEGGESQREVKR